MFLALEKWWAKRWNYIKITKWSFDWDARCIFKALLKENIRRCFFNFYGIYKIFKFGVYVTNSEKENLDKFKEVVEKNLWMLLRMELKKKSNCGTLNRTEFSVRELLSLQLPELDVCCISTRIGCMAKNPYGITCFWWCFIRSEEILNNRLLEKDIEEKILNNNHKAFIVCSPSAGLNDKRIWLKKSG